MTHLGREVKQHLELLAVMSGKKDIDDCKALGKGPQKKIQHEAKEQEALFLWANLQKSTYPELTALFAIPNGGSRHKLEAYSLKRQGVKSGIPDIFLAVAKGTFHGLFIEMKFGKNKTSETQNEWIERLKTNGYKVVVCYGFEEAKEEILKYLK